MRSTAYVGAINEAFEPAVAGRHAMIGMGTMILLHSPPQTGGGVSAVFATLARGGTGGAMMPKPRQPGIFPHRGRVANAVSINIRNHGLAFAFFIGSQPILVMLKQVINIWR